MSRRIRVTIIMKDCCYRSSKVSIKDILDAGGLKEFIEEIYRKRGIIPNSAIQLFSVGKNKGVVEAIKILKEIKLFDTELYFITPIQLLTAEDLVIPYRECLDDLSIDEIKRFFNIFNVTDEILEIIESQPEILYIYANNKLIKILGLLDYIPKNTIAFLAMDSPAISRLKNLRVVYPTHKTISQLRKMGVRISQENFGGAFLHYFALVLSKLFLEMGLENFINYIEMAKGRPEILFDIVLSCEAYSMIKRGRIESLLKFLK